MRGRREPEVVGMRDAGSRGVEMLGTGEHWKREAKL